VQAADRWLFKVVSTPVGDGDHARDGPKEALRKRAETFAAI